MSLLSRIFTHAAALPKAHTHELGVERDLAVPMQDGTPLLADRHFPRNESNGLPLVLMRTPYGRRSFDAFAEVFAERGYQVIVQSSRGTFGSGGEFRAFLDDERDGRATLEWIATQDWFGGKVAMFGPSYLGYAQWAVAANAPGFLKALGIQIATSNRRESIYPGESFALDFALSWIRVLAGEGQPVWRTLWARMRDRKALAPSFLRLPLSEADSLRGERRFGFYQDWLTHTEPNDPYWKASDFSHRMSEVTAHVNLVGGWYDLYIERMLRDFQSLRAAGKAPRLILGPWMHTDSGALFTGLRESLAWFDRRLRNTTSNAEVSANAEALPVRLFELGSKQWFELPDWPPRAQPARWYLHPGRALASSPAVTSVPDEYDYDPAHPTPSLGGAVLGRHGGARDNRSLESRPDVLVYTSQPLDFDLHVAGTVSVNLFVRSSLEHTDFFARLCDVDAKGRSINLCDGIVRLKPGRFQRAADGTMQLQIGLSPTACCFLKGHRIRLQVSSGAHPRFSRNPGSGEPLGSATVLRSAHQEVFHDPEHPSWFELPVWDGSVGSNSP